MTASEIVALLQLAPHPEGGWFRETFRDAPGADGRAASTAIYYLLAAGQTSHWHRVTDAAEAWHFHAGAPLALSLAPYPRGAATTVLLGADLAAGQRPQAIVPAGDWQGARSLGDWSLVGCTVAPGFQFSSFEMAPPGWTPDA
jgi:predicted cupin superfamily sugar epimerase